MNYLGNKLLLTYKKIGFLASSHIDVSEVMACYEWAARKAEQQTCVMSGFSSRMEKEVLHFLLKAKTPVIWVLSRRLYKELPAKELQEALDDNRLLIISLSDAPRQSRAGAFKRNGYIAGTADRLLFTGVTKESSLYPLYESYKSKLLPMDKSPRSIPTDILLNL